MNKREGKKKKKKKKKMNIASYTRLFGVKAKVMQPVRPSSPTTINSIQQQRRPTTDDR
jgi:hypothetical protein